MLHLRLRIQHGRKQTWSWPQMNLLEGDRQPTNLKKKLLFLRYSAMNKRKVIENIMRT